MNVCFENAAAFAPMTEQVIWAKDGAPNRRAVFSAIVLQGSPDSMNAGNPLGEITADKWTVEIRNRSPEAALIRVGDTLSRIGIGAEVFAVQEITPTETGYMLTCTAKARATR